MDVEDSITINKEYASKYEKKKRAEELSKLRDQYGDGESESSSSDEEEEDENAEMLTATVEEDFLRTLSLIYSKDPRIYKEDAQFFRREEDRPVEEKEKEEKPMYLKDYERKQLMERGAMAGVSDSEGEDGTNDKQRLPFATYLEEQEQLKVEFCQAVKEKEEEGVREDEDLLTLRKKNKEEIEQEERGYVLWLKGEKEKMAAGESDLVGLRNVWADPNLDSGEAFLRDYILNRRFIDTDDIRPEVPTYDDIVGDSDDSGEREGEGEEEVGVSDDEASLNRQEDFERKYNFRFEEPEGAQITSYPRTVAGSVRREDDRRKEKRKLRDERREREREQKEEELKRLKKLKRREIKEKLEKIKSITGNPNVGFSVGDLDGDFDPTSYDEVMAKAFDDGYYGMEEEGEEGEDGKPVFSEDDEECGDWDEWETGEGEEPHCEDPAFNMDADYDPETASEPPTSSKKSKYLKHKHKLAQAVSVKKPRFDPEEKTFEEYFDEYYNLDYEDIVGDMPCRFNYSQVLANSFGLSVEEILACEDKELNQWVSLKKSVQIRTEEEEEKDKRIYKKKARNFKKKYQILASLKEPQEEQEGGKESRKKSKKPSTSQVSEDSEKDDQQTSGEKIPQQEDEATVNVELVQEDGHHGVATSSSRKRVRPKTKAKAKKPERVDLKAGNESHASTSKKLKRRKKHKISNSAAKKLSTARLKSYGL